MKRMTLMLAALMLATPAAAQTLLIGNKGEDTVSFVDLRSGRELGRAATGRMPHEIAISPDGRQAAVVAYGARAIDIFDIASRRRVRSIDLSPNEGPHGIVWLPDGRILASTERSRSLTIVDTRAGDRVSAIPTNQETTHMVVVTPDRRLAFTANIRSGSVSVIDLVRGAKIRDIVVGGQPEGIDLSPDGRTLWVGDNQGSRVLAYDVAAIAGAGDPPAAALATIVTGATPIRVLASPDGRWIVTSNFGDGTVSVIDARTRRLARTIRVSGERAAQQVTILFSRDGRRLYVAETARNLVAEVDLASGRVLRRLPAGTNGDGLAIAP